MMVSYVKIERNIPFRMVHIIKGNGWITREMDEVFKGGIQAKSMRGNGKKTKRKVLEE